MSFCRLWIIAFLLMGFSAHAFELIVIQAVSDSKRTFITRNGKRQGLIIGMKGTFTADDISVLAKAINVTGNFAQWELVNQEAILPFEKGKIVTYYPATEYIWALAPESERRKYIKSEVQHLRRSWVFKGALTRGLNESVSDAPATTTNRGGFMGEVYHERDIYNNFSYDIGLRYEREVVNYPGASLITRRSMIIADIIYYFEFLREFVPGRFFIATGLGYGLSNTSTVGLSQSGPVSILPLLKAGINLPFNEDWEFVTDAAFESLQTNEKQESGNKQTTTQTNLKFGFGLRRNF